MGCVFSHIFGVVLIATYLAWVDLHLNKFLWSFTERKAGESLTWLRPICPRQRAEASSFVGRVGNDVGADFECIIADSSRRVGVIRKTETELAQRYLF
jgi:hypothetical protein